MCRSLDGECGCVCSLGDVSGVLMRRLQALSTVYVHNRWPRGTGDGEDEEKEKKGVTLKGCSAHVLSFL